MNQTMEFLKRMEERNYSILVRVLFGLDSPTPVLLSSKEYQSEIGAIEFADQTLNDSQKEAVIFALVSREIALIHGPPGVSFLALPMIRGEADLH